MTQIQTEGQYKAIMQQIEDIMLSDKKEDSDLLEQLIVSAYEYEKEHYPIEEPSEEAIKRFRAEQKLIAY